jgi:hypothetical protein
MLLVGLLQHHGVESSA